MKETIDKMTYKFCFSLMWKRAEGLHTKLLWKLLGHQVSFYVSESHCLGRCLHLSNHFSIHSGLGTPPSCSGFRRKMMGKIDKRVKREHHLAWNKLSRNLTCYFQLYFVGQNPANGHTPSCKEKKAKIVLAGPISIFNINSECCYQRRRREVELCGR